MGRRVPETQGGRSPTGVSGSGVCVNQCAKDRPKTGKRWWSRDGDPGLPGDEFASCAAPAINDGAVQVPGREMLPVIARELVRTVRLSVIINRLLRELLRANLRRLVQRILPNHGYPPDKQESATRTVIEHPEARSAAPAV